MKDIQNKNVSLSLVICTFNRSDLLEKLVRLFDQEVVIPQNLELEIIVVDNNSTDSTKEIIARMISVKRPYTLRYFLENKSGLSNARNRGIKESKFKRIGFIDDDVMPERNFLAGLCNAFIAFPDTACMSPRIIYHSERRPDWYVLEGKYPMLDRGGYDLGCTSRFLVEDDALPIGAGMFFSKSLFTDFGYFDADFGYDSTKLTLIPGEESEILLKMKAKNVRMYYVHDAVLHHYPKQEKYDLKTLKKTYWGIGYWYGSYDARTKTANNLKPLLGYPMAYYKRLLLDSCSFLFSRLTKNLTIKHYYRFRVEEAKGYFIGFKRFRKK